jgi:hypothetical protein
LSHQNRDPTLTKIGNIILAFRTSPRGVTEDADHNQLLATNFRDLDQQALSITG